MSFAYANDWSKTRDLPEIPLSATSVEATTWAQELIWQADAQSSRSTQAHVGPSEVGDSCTRALAMKLAGVPALRVSPGSMSAITGTGLHAWMAERIDTLYGNTNRYLTETPVEFRGIKGTSDLYDRLHARSLDWKTVTKSNLKTYAKHQQWTHSWLVQTSIYASGLQDRGEIVNEVAIGLVPREGSINDVVVLTRPHDRSIAINAIRRLDTLRGVDYRTLPICRQRFCLHCPRESDPETEPGW